MICRSRRPLAARRNPTASVSARLLRVLRALLRVVVFLAVGITVALLLLEGALRLIDPFHYGETIEREHYAAALLERGDDGRLRLRPGAQASYLGHEVLVNGHGLRTPPVSRNKPRGVYRILVVGDSVAFGWGVAERDCFPRVLERMLEARAPIGERLHFEVVNGAVPGWGLGDMYLFVKEHGLGWAPDLVIATFINNDIPIVEALGTDRAPPPPRVLPEELRWSYLARAVHHSLGVLQDRLPTGDFFADLQEVPKGLDAVCQGFGLLKEACGSVPLVVLDTVGVRGKGGLPEVVDCLQQLGIHRVQGYLADSDYRALYSVAATDDHPNAAGHEQLAEWLYDWLTKYYLN